VGVPHAWPAGQLAHAVAFPATEYVPAAHVWHAVDTPSTKYVPAPQHTAVPEGAQRFVVVPAVHPGSVQAMAEEPLM
jgi:hypothetical protein